MKSECYIYRVRLNKMKDLTHIKRFNESEGNLNISAVSDSKKLTMIFGDDNTISKNSMMNIQKIQIF